MIISIVQCVKGANGHKEAQARVETNQIVCEKTKQILKSS